MCTQTIRRPVRNFWHPPANNYFERLSIQAICRSHTFKLVVKRLSSIAQNSAYLVTNLMAKPFTIEYLIGDIFETTNQNATDIDHNDDDLKTDSIHDLSQTNHSFENQQKNYPIQSIEIPLSNSNSYTNNKISSTTTIKKMNKSSKIKGSSYSIQEYHPALRDVSVRLEGSSLWNKFHAYGTEMIVTKSGRFVINF